MDTKDELIAWFKGRELPTDHLRISGYETTDHVANLVELAVANMERGNDTSQAVPRRLNVKLGQESTRTAPTP